MLKRYIIPILFIGSTVLFSCVSSKKFKSANAEVDRLTAQNNTLQQQVNDLNSSNQSVSAEYSSYKTGCEATQKKLDAYQKKMDAYQMALEEEQKKVQEVVKIIEAAEVDFADQGVEVYEKDGRIHVNMQDKLMYKSGSSKMGEDGKKALEALAGALNKYPNLQVIVVGHTDNAHFKDIHKDNLSLSTERANGVVRTLRDEYGVDPVRLVAAGQGMYAPVADNSTDEGKAKNRRTEIILNPDLHKIWNAVETN